MTCGCYLSGFDDFGVESSRITVSLSQVTGHRANSSVSYDGSLSMAATVKQTCESTNNKITDWWILTVFSFQLVWGVVWAPPIYRGIRSLGARLRAHPMAATVKQSRW